MRLKKPLVPQRGGRAYTFRGQARENNVRLDHENNAMYDYHNILYGITKIKTLFGVTPNEDDYLENALNALRKIGNVHRAMYGINGVTDENGKLCLPTKAISVEAVSTGYFDWVSFSPNNFPAALYPSGEFIPYQFFEDHVQIQFPRIEIAVMYKSYIQDENGFPMVTEFEADALAYWWIWVDTRRKFYQRDPAAQSYLQQAVFDKNKAVNQARIPEKINQNLFDQILNVRYSSDRKTYNDSFKPIKISNG